MDRHLYTAPTIRPSHVDLRGVIKKAFINNNNHNVWTHSVIINQFGYTGLLVLRQTMHPYYYYYQNWVLKIAPTMQRCPWSFVRKTLRTILIGSSRWSGRDLLCTIVLCDREWTGAGQRRCTAKGFIESYPLDVRIIVNALVSEHIPARPEWNERPRWKNWKNGTADWRRRRLVGYDNLIPFASCSDNLIYWADHHIYRDSI